MVATQLTFVGLSLSSKTILFRFLLLDTKNMYLIVLFYLAAGKEDQWQVH